ncbi:MAG: hypothetical protein IJ327_01525 [Lachnospiraceae bacterium]|nr:hypothetical protein [Lachnospiraceae bacterium]
MAGQGIKEYDELLFTDDFLFCKVLENNEDLCKELLELILGKKIRRINYLAKQKVIDITSDGKGVRLDVYPFKQKELHLYTFENRCNENMNISLGDESTKVILTPDGKAKDVSEGLTEFLN